MARVDIYRYHVTQADGTDIMLELEYDAAESLGLDIKDDIAPRSTWAAKDY